MKTMKTRLDGAAAAARQFELLLQSVAWRRESPQFSPKSLPRRQQPAGLCQQSGGKSA